MFEVLGCLWGVRGVPRACGQAPQGEECASGVALVGKGTSSEEHPWLLPSAFQRFNGVESAPSRPSILMN